MFLSLAQAAQSSGPSPKAWGWILGLTAVVGLIGWLMTRKSRPPADPQAGLWPDTRGGDPLGGPGGVGGSSLGYSQGPSAHGSHGVSVAVGGAVNPDSHDVDTGGHDGHGDGDDGGGFDDGGFDASDGGFESAD